MKKIITLIISILLFTSCTDIIINDINTDTKLKHNWMITETVVISWKTPNNYMLYNNVNVNTYNLINKTENEVYEFINKEKKSYKNGDIVKIFNGVEYYSMYTSFNYDIKQLYN